MTVMTPKDKAKELYNRFYSMYAHPNSVEERNRIAKESAIIVCNEVLGHMGADRGYQFWDNVRDEIKKF